MKPRTSVTKTPSKPHWNGPNVKTNHRIRECITIEGAREHNLKNISLEIPKKKFVIITGPSGSGKSTLAFDTIFAEGQRRYVESLSAYAKQFLEQLKKPDVDSIQGLCPSIAIQQKTISKNPRSTVGTITEIYDYLRLLYSRVGETFCPSCETPVTHQSLQQIVEQIQHLPEKSKVSILAIVAQKKKGEFAKEINDIVRSGHVRARVDGREVSLELGQRLEKNKPHTIEVYIDRLILDEQQQARLEQAVEVASQLGKGRILVETTEPKKTSTLYSQSLSCPGCGFSLPELSPRLFSFNSPVGACSHCRGLGYLYWEENEEDIEIEDSDSEEAESKTEICPECEGTRLNEAARSVLIRDQKISDIVALTPQEAYQFFDELELSGNAKLIGEKVIQEIKGRLKFLELVGLDYLQLNRLSATLSGGEEQRVRLATQLGVQLTGVLYILDEPSIGLHQVDNDRLIKALKDLRDAGNTVIVVEHDLDTILAADVVIDLGPGAGRHGGYLVDQASPSELKKGITADFILGREKIETPKVRRSGNGKFLEIHGANLHNLKDVHCRIPLGCFNVVTGVSGSGKSSLIMEVLFQSLHANKALHCKSIQGQNEIDKIIRVTQSPIGRTPRSNPATYIGAFGPIRDLYAKLPLSRQRGYKPTRFSFNTKGGRCENCQGAGQVKMEMHFLPNVRVDCDVCYTRRYNPPTLEVLYKGKSIFDVLELSFEEAVGFFENLSQIRKKMQVMVDVGLGYLKLGQAATTLSGGEAQRVKLAKELVKVGTGKTLYILDEPTTGLHLVDIRQLLKICQSLVDKGNTIVMIEHQLDVIRSADHLIDLGPLGGVGGGEIMATGTPEVVAVHPKSLTGKYLRPMMGL
jgi:excinuclease ABC subunit A